MNRLRDLLYPWVERTTALFYGVSNRPSGERGAVDAGSCAIGIFVGLLAGWLLWKNGGV